MWGEGVWECGGVGVRRRGVVGMWELGCVCGYV